MEKLAYIRVGTSYFKQVNAPTIAGDFNQVLVPWNIDTIKQDYGKDFIGQILKYDGFTCIPSHTSFKQVCSGFYNRYSPLSHKPEEGPIEVSMRFLNHIFGSQSELGLDRNVKWTGTMLALRVPNSAPVGFDYTAYLE